MAVRLLPFLVTTTAPVASLTLPLNRDLSSDTTVVIWFFQIRREKFHQHLYLTDLSFLFFPRNTINLRCKPPILKKLTETNMRRDRHEVRHPYPMS
ncbi:predicted protein [Arabidopsis lyrata subsp. lyrata]|uniref:Predicted protein n=1 Tax=Arabidopsis lyrata subsp. lyrata TaxID=81972 RepID=D7MVV6_ARALL|nr:predicted protein [Arabidopsis lyrata subsp. lyrata]